MKILLTDPINVADYDANNMKANQLYLAYIKSKGYAFIVKNDYNTWINTIESNKEPVNMIEWQLDDIEVESLTKKIVYIFKDYIDENIGNIKGNTNKVIDDLRIDIIGKLFDDLRDRQEANAVPLKRNYSDKAIIDLIDNPAKQFDFYSKYGALFKKPSIYKPSNKLLDLGYKYDDNALYCPLDAKLIVDNKIMEYYLKISRNETYYTYTLGYYEKKRFYNASTTYQSTTSIVNDSKERYKTLHEYANSINDLNQTKYDSEPIIDLKTFKTKLSEIAIALSNESNYSQITDEFKKYKAIEDAEKNKEDDASNVAEYLTFEDYPNIVKKQAIETIKDGNLFEIMKNGISLKHAKSETSKEIALLVCASPFVDLPVHSLLNADTGKGKTDLIKETLENYPDIITHSSRSISPKYLYYNSDEYSNPVDIIVLDDVDLTIPEMIELIKGLADANGILKHETIIHGKSKKFELKGKFLIFLTYAKSIPDDELKNRFYNIPIIIKNEDKKTVKNQIRNNRIVDADNNQIIKRSRLFNKACIHYLIEKDISVFNPFILYLNPIEFNNRDISHFISLVKAKTFYEIGKRQCIEINNYNLYVGSKKDFDFVAKIWNSDADVQKYKLSTKQKQIIDYLKDNEFVFNTLEDAYKFIEKKEKDYENAGNKASRNYILNGIPTLKKLAKELNVNQSTLKNDLDRQDDNRTAKSLYELGLIEKLQFNISENSYRNFYCIINDNSESLNLNKNTMSNMYIENTWQNQTLNQKISIIINILYYVNIIINEDGYTYLQQHCKEYETFDLEDYNATVDFIQTFFDNFIIDYYTVPIEFATKKQIDYATKIYEKHRDMPCNTTASNNDMTTNIHETTANQKQTTKTLCNNKTHRGHDTINSINKHLESLGYNPEIVTVIYDILTNTESMKQKDLIDKLLTIFKINPEKPNDHMIMKINKNIKKLIDEKYIANVTVNGFNQLTLKDYNKNLIYDYDTK